MNHDELHDRDALRAPESNASSTPAPSPVHLQLAGWTPAVFCGEEHPLAVTLRHANATCQPCLEATEKGLLTGLRAPELTAEERAARSFALMEDAIRRMPGAVNDYGGVLLRRSGRRVTVVCQVHGRLTDIEAEPGDLHWTCRSVIAHVEAGENCRVAVREVNGLVYGRKDG